MKKVAFYTLGCKVNQYETNAMAEQFINNGYEITEFNNNADIYVINTCTVTNMSDRKSRQIIRRSKEKNNNAIVVVTGCYAQVAKQELEKIEEIDLLIGNSEKKNIVNIVEEYCRGVFFDDSKKINISDISNQKEYTEFGNTAYTEKTRAVIKVQDGCNNFCSYCIIPYAKGRVRSRNLENIITEIKNIAIRRNTRSSNNRNTYSFIWNRF